MFWYACLVKVLLFVGAAVLVTDATDIFELLSLSTDQSMSPLRVIDAATGLMYTAAAVFAVVTRFKLKNFRRCAPGMVTALCLTLSAINLFSAGAATVVTGTDRFNVDAAVSAAAGIVMALINSTYFKNRRFLFKN